MHKLIEKAVSSLLDRLGSGWKTIIGIAAILVIKILDHVDVLDPDFAASLYEWAVLVTGVGIFHRTLRTKQEAEEAKSKSDLAMKLGIENYTRLHDELS